MNDADVIVVGAGPVGLMLAGELCLAGLHPLVLERRPQRRDIPKAGGVGGRILDVLRYRGMLERFEAASARPAPAPRFPFGGLHLDFSHLTDSPMAALPLAQPRLEHLLEDYATQRGAEIRRGHEVTGLRQDDDAITAEVHGQGGRYRLTAPYLVGCDGPRSRVRDLAGIPFPGTTYPEVNRVGQITIPEPVTVLDNGDLDVRGGGRIQAGFTRTERGVFGLGARASETLFLYTSEDESTAYDDDAPMPLAELQDSITRVLGVHLPLGEPRRLSRFTFQARHAARYREGRVLLAGDAAHLFPATGVALNAGMLDAVNLAWKLGATVHGWAPPGLLDTYHRERHQAGARTLLHTQAQVALRRGLDPAADALRELFEEVVADEQPLRRMGALLAGSDIRYGGTGEHPLTGTFAPDLTLHTGQGTTSVARLMRPARPVLLDLAGRRDLREAARDWRPRVEIYTAKTGQPPADAILIRPDAHIAWSATGEDTDASTLPEALSGWFGAPS